ncbi:hypothetical protein DM01DRAFT_1362723 [Hesseltinella vesiculosa]|uniref:Pep3/Vps18 beta-propeller domain-containing protein n=1 Tax=Hesseltinella vesiculosa TaxID=101127 RepID=A0A1X2GJ56_9FUNG|nr:hypothetical protein DM01DRAFT_1362723 [Hesseltinella vesiculosa]
MSLLDDFIESSQQPPNLPSLPEQDVSNQQAASYTSDSSLNDTAPPPPIAKDVFRSIPSSQFRLDQVQFHLPALLQDMVVSNNILIIVLSNQRLLRVDLDDPLEVGEIEWARRPNDGKLVGLHLDPTGRHLLLCTDHGESYYMFHEWKKVKYLSRLKGLLVTALGWNEQASPSQNATQEILLGTQNGQVYETWIEPTDEYFKKEERYLHQVYTLPTENLPDPSPLATRITGIQISKLVHHGQINDHAHHVLITTPSRMYQFLGTANSGSSASHENGSPMFASLFAQYTNPSFQELPGDVDPSDLCVYKVSSSTLSFAWNTAPGIYQGQLDLQASTTDEMIVHPQLILYPTSTYENGNEEASPVTPSAMALTAHHLILLYHQRVKVINCISQQTVFEESIPILLGKGERILGLSADTVYHTYWIYTTSAIYEVVVQNEDSKVWQLYLDKKDYDRALASCKTSQQTNAVHIARANDLFERKQFLSSATYYAKTNVTFEQVVLQFMEKKEKDALRVYLLAKLQRLDSKARTQKSILSTWLVEIYLAKINQIKELMSSVKHTSTYYDGTMAPKGQTAIAHYEQLGQQVKQEFQAFLQENQSYLHKATVYKLISSHGHTKELIYYATLLNDDDKVISYWIEQREYTKALDTLGKQSDLDLFYKHSPALMEHMPRETHQAARYLSHVVDKLHNTDPAVHNALLTLYATQATKDETALLSFLKSEGIDMYYNPDYALRLCNQFGRVQSCIYLYSVMGLYEEAVHLALQIGDIDEAVIHADKPFDNDEQIKKLWLAIAEYVIQEKRDIKRAMDYVKESNVLKIEDILPFFPDHILINDFKASRNKKKRNERSG